EMQVIAALDPKRNIVAERSKHEVGPRAQRDHGFARDDSARRSIHPPPARGLFKGARVADYEPAAFALEQCSIGLGQSAGIGNEARLRKIYCAAKLTAEIGLFQRDRLAIENIALNS